MKNNVFTNSYRSIRLMLLALLLPLLILGQGTVFAQGVSELVVGEHVNAQLVAENETAVPGESLWVALKLVHTENWHTYWINPGDAGKPTEITWQLPEGVTAGEIVWPLPERFELPADLVDFGYTEEIFLLTELTVPKNYSATSLAVSAVAVWLECEEICIPGGAIVDLNIRVSDSTLTDSRWAYGFSATRGSLPREDIVLDSMFLISDDNINLLVQATDPIFDNAANVTFLSDTHRIIDYISDQDITYQLSSMQLSQKAHSRALREVPERIGGLLVVEDTEGQITAYDVEAAPEGVSLAALDGLLPATSVNAAGDMGMLMIFLFAMTGGIILNLMPCVFPVLSLKAMSLASNANAPVREQRLHGVAYAAGVILSFLTLAVILLSLQAGGALIGWGFQLQSPWFVAALVYLFFLMGLSMSGVIEIGSGIMGIGSDLSDKEGYTGSFFTGVLASVVASPCTAPFMGVALGFAFTQTMLVALTVFFALGFGMALPFLLFSFIPALAKMLPQPGSWMLTFRQILAFPLYATAVWLLWVLGRQTSVDAMALIVMSCVFIAGAAWLYQRQTQSKWRYLEYAVIWVCIMGVFSVLNSPMLKIQQTTTVAAAGENYEVYSDARLAELRNSGTPVFVNMTASWCITCLVNERVVLSSDTVTQALADRNVTYLKGDWTNNDPVITEVLKRFQTSGVPLYLMYPANINLPAEVLPQILTEGIILNALERI